MDGRITGQRPWEPRVYLGMGDVLGTDNALNKTVMRATNLRGGEVNQIRIGGFGGATACERFLSGEAYNAGSLPLKLGKS